MGNSVMVPMMLPNGQVGYMLQPKNNNPPQNNYRSGPY